MNLIDLRISYKALMGDFIAQKLENSYVYYLENSFCMSFGDFVMFCDDDSKLQEAFQHTITYNDGYYLNFNACVFFATNQDILIVGDALNKVMALLLGATICDKKLEKQQRSRK